jgi:hypothetical protein
MRDENPLTLRQVDQLPTDIANFESELEVVMAQIAQLPKRGEIWCAAVMGMLGSVLTTALCLAFFLR